MKANEVPERYKTCDWLWNYGSIGLTKEHIKRLNNAINILESVHEYTDAKYLKEIKDKLLEDTSKTKIGEIERSNMTQYIDKAAVVAEIERRWRNLANKNLKSNGKYDIKISTLLSIKTFLDTLEVKEVNLEQPEPYFYCKYGGIIPLCSDCKRNHSNSSFKTEEIITWFVPSKGSKYCIDYVQQEQPKLDIEKIIEKTYHDRSVTDTSDMDHVSYENIARHFFELGIKAAQKGE